MTTRQQRVQALYKIALAIGPEQTLQQTADTALTAYLQKLNCSVGAIYQTPTEHDQLSLIASIPATPDQNDLFQAAYDELTETIDAARRSTMQQTDRGRPNRPAIGSESRQHADISNEVLPVSGVVGETGHYHLMELPGFGVLLLGKQGGALATETVSALRPLNEKLSQACQSNLTKRRLRAQNERFEAIFRSIPEPLTNVVVEDGTEIILSANEAFENTFDCPAESVQGQPVQSVVSPKNPEVDTEELIRTLDQGETFRTQLSCATASGEGYFLFNAVPIVSVARTEYFGVYIDITEQKQRQQTLEELNYAAQQLISAESRTEVCERAVTAVQSILEYTTVGVHLYDRNSEALVPVATSDPVRDKFDDGPPSYTNRDTVVWKAYRSGDVVDISDMDVFDDTLHTQDTPVRSATILPLGAHGVLITSASEPNAIADDDIYFLRLLSEFIETALNQVTNEAGLAVVQRTVRNAVQAETHEDMAATVLKDVPEVLDLPIAGIWQYRPARQVLEPLAQTDQANSLFDHIPTFSSGDSLAWQTFNSGTKTIISDVSEHPERYNPDTPIKGEIIVPIGEFGILTAGSTHPNSFTELDAEILNVLATNLTVVAEVIDSRQDITLLDQVVGRILRHNVRNKLVPIQGLAKTITKNATPPIKQHARRIEESCTELEQTAKHAQEMREIVQERTQVTTLSLAREVNTAVSTVRTEFPDGELITQINADPEVTAHPQLSTALRHLLRNGFQHNTSQHPRIKVVVELRADRPIIEISDNGPGIETHEIEVINRHDESALSHGSGAGLWVIDRVISYSEALLEFDTADGTTVTITFSNDSQHN